MMIKKFYTHMAPDTMEAVVRCYSLSIHKKIWEDKSKSGKNIKFKKSDKFDPAY